MAALSITIGPVTATRQIDNALAQTVTTLLLERLILPNLLPGTPAPATPQAQLQAVVDWIAIGMRDKARQARRWQLQMEQEAALAEEVAAIDI